MTIILKQLKEVADFDSQTLIISIKSYKKYLHLGVKFNNEAILVGLMIVVKVMRFGVTKVERLTHLEWKRRLTFTMS